MSNPRDRTAEFRQCQDSIRSRNPQSTSSSNTKSTKKLNKPQTSKSEVAKLAAGIAKDINATTGKLQKLAQRESRAISPLLPPPTSSLPFIQPRVIPHVLILFSIHPVAKRKTLFDDRPVEISVRIGTVRTHGSSSSSTQADASLVIPSPSDRNSHSSLSKTSRTSTLRLPPSRHSPSNRTPSRESSQQQSRSTNTTPTSSCSSRASLLTWVWDSRTFSRSGPR